MNWAWQLRLKPTIKFVLMALADAADDEGYCWPSVPTLARKTCMDQRSVQRILKTLKDNNLIEVQARFRNDGSPTSNKYWLAMNTTGDKLSPPLSRHCNREVVTNQPPPDGTAVTQTTNEPSYNRTQLLLTAGEACCSSDYIFPKQLNLEEQQLAKIQLASLDTVLGQAVLDELAARLNANKITGAPLSYLRSLITRAKAGQFTPEAGIRIAAIREQTKITQRQRSTEITKPTDPTQIPKFLAAMHQALARKHQS